jgi:hypothetical protein
LLFHGIFLKYKETDTGQSKNEFKKRANCDGPNSDQFDGQSVQALVDEILQRIIHKAMALNPAERFKQGGSNAHTHVGPLAALVGAHVAGVVGTFVKDTQLGGLQPLHQARMDLLTQGKGDGVHSLSGFWVASLSLGRYLEM